MTLHRSSEDLEGHMNTGIEWPVYAYVGHEGSEGEEVARLRAENERLSRDVVRFQNYCATKDVQLVKLKREAKGRAAHIMTLAKRVAYYKQQTYWLKKNKYELEQELQSK